jgi:hypothetical protein
MRWQQSLRVRMTNCQLILEQHLPSMELIYLCGHPKREYCRWCCKMTARIVFCVKQTATFRAFFRQAGDRYTFLVDGKGLFPDLASRYQPEGPHGWGEIVDPSAFQWSDRKKLSRELELKAAHRLFYRRGKIWGGKENFLVYANLGLRL